MRIAICSDQYLPVLSGVADSVELLAKTLREEGHVVRIYTSNFPGAVEDETIFRFPAYTPAFAGGAIIFAVPWGAMRDIKRFKPEVIHTQQPGVVGMFSIYASWRLGVPLVGTDHLAPAEYLHYFGLNFRVFKCLVKKFMSWFYARAHVVTAPSEHILDELYDYGMRVAHREVISNPVKLDFFKPLPNKEELKAKYGVGEKAVLLFGRIAVEKNLAFAAEVFKEVTKEADAQLVILGGGPYQKELQEKVVELGLTSKTKFLGVLRGGELVEALNTAEILLVTSLSEIQPMATLQAMSLGLPVVAARAGGMPSVVVDGTTGFLIDPADKEAYAKRIIELLSDKTLRNNFGEAARKAVQGYYPKQIVHKFLHVYEKAREISQK